MKKVIFLSVLSLLIILFSQERVEYAYKERVDGYYRYELIFENKEISTVNFMKYFTDYKVLTIYPSIPQIYKNIMSFTKYSFDGYQSISTNITKFESKYVDCLENMGYRKEALKIRTSGIFIEKIIIYGEENQILQLKYHFPQLRYRLLDE